jgi:hypothetical protein
VSNQALPAAIGPSWILATQQDYGSDPGSGTPGHSGYLSQNNLSNPNVATALRAELNVMQANDTALPEFRFHRVPVKGDRPKTMIAVNKYEVEPSWQFVQDIFADVSNNL